MCPGGVPAGDWLAALCTHSRLQLCTHPSLVPRGTYIPSLKNSPGQVPLQPWGAGPVVWGSAPTRLSPPASPRVSRKSRCRPYQLREPASRQKWRPLCPAEDMREQGRAKFSSPVSSLQSRPGSPSLRTHCCFLWLGALRKKGVGKPGKHTG